MVERGATAFFAWLAPVRFTFYGNRTPCGIMRCEGREVISLLID